MIWFSCGFFRLKNKNVHDLIQIHWRANVKINWCITSFKAEQYLLKIVIWHQNTKQCNYHAGNNVFPHILMVLSCAPVVREEKAPRNETVVSIKSESYYKIKNAMHAWLFLVWKLLSNILGEANRFLQSKAYQRNEANPAQIIKNINRAVENILVQWEFGKSVWLLKKFDYLCFFFKLKVWTWNILNYWTNAFMNSSKKWKLFFSKWRCLI